MTEPHYFPDDPFGPAGMRFEMVEALSLHEQFRLVEIAHETSNSEIRAGALKVLGKYLNSLIMAVPAGLNQDGEAV